MASARSSSSDHSWPGISALLENMYTAAISACVAETASLPLDTVKVRLQIQQSMPGSTTSGMMQCFKSIVVEEGPLALWKGLTPGLARQIVFASLRIGLYNPIRDFYASNSSEITLTTRIAAGLTTGMIGITFANPVDLIKVRLQAEARLHPNAPKRYNGLIDAFVKIYRTEGLRGFWTAYIPNLCRNSIINASELAAYDQLKTMAIESAGLSPNHVTTHLMCAVGAGFCATVVGSPIDVLKTRLMNDKAMADGRKRYAGLSDAAVKVLRSEGPLAFYKGFAANFARIGSWNVIMFLTLEQIRAFVKL